LFLISIYFANCDIIASWLLWSWCDYCLVLIRIREEAYFGLLLLFQIIDRLTFLTSSLTTHFSKKTVQTVKFKSFLKNSINNKASHDKNFDNL
jgi:hypothetical protein